MKRLQLLFIFLFLMITGLAKADMQFGNSESYIYHLPLDASKPTSYLQSVYEKEKLAPGDITFIQLNVKATTIHQFNNVKIYMKEVDNLDAPEARITDGTLVYDGIIGTSGGEGYIQLNFDTPFPYTNTKHLAVLVQHETGAGNFVPETFWGCHDIEHTSFGGAGVLLDEMDDRPLKTRMDIVIGGLVPTVYGGITGTVTDEATGLPLSGIYVLLDGYGEAVTDENGYYYISPLPVATYKVKYKDLDYYRYNPIETEVTINQDVYYNINQQMKKPDPSVSPTIFDETLNINEYKKLNLGITNSGNGKFNWHAKVLVYGEDQKSTKTFKASPNNNFTPIDKSKKQYRRRPMRTAKGQATFSPKLRDYLGSRDIYSVVYENYESSFFGKFNTDNPATYDVMMELENEELFFSAMDFRRSCPDEIIMVDVEGNIYLQTIDDEENCVLEFIKQYEEPYGDEIYGMATDPTTGKMYLNTPERLYLMDPTTFEIELIGKFGIASDMVQDIAFDQHGDLYAVDYYDHFLEIDKYNGKAAEIGHLGVNTDYDKGLTFDPVAKQFLVSVVEVPAIQPQLRIIDFATGLSELVGNLPDGYYMPTITTSFEGVDPLWITIDKVKGHTAPNEGITNLGIHITTEGLNAGEVYDAEIAIKSKHNPNQNFYIPVNISLGMTELPVVEDLGFEFLDVVGGKLRLDWSVSSDEGIQMYKILMNDEIIGLTNEKFYEMDLPYFGNFTYKVLAILDDNTETTPTEPFLIVWPAPALCGLTTYPSTTAFDAEPIYFYDTMENCGKGFLTFEIAIPDWETGGEFLKEIYPDNGIVGPGEKQVIRYKYYAEEGDFSLHAVTTECTTNAPAPGNSFQTLHQFTTTEAGTFSGIILDRSDDTPLNGVKIHAKSIDESVEFVTYTDDNGNYRLRVDPHTYTIQYSYAGYNTQYKQSFAVGGDNIVLNVDMDETPYAPKNAGAIVNVGEDPPSDSFSLVTWELPYGPYECYYDDNSAENYIIGENPGDAFAVKFEPLGHPATITGAKFYVGDGFYPGYDEFMNSKMIVSVHAENSEGLPGELLAKDTATLDTYGWFECPDIFDVDLEDGNFFIAYTQYHDQYAAPPLGLDEQTEPAYKSYVYNQEEEEWQAAPTGNIMIRAIVYGPNEDNLFTEEPKLIRPERLPASYNVQRKNFVAAGYTKEAKTFGRTDLLDSREITSYEIARIIVEDPEGEYYDDPAMIIHTNVQAEYFQDDDFGDLADGYYAYKVRAKYNDEYTSEWTYSNVLIHGLYANINLNLVASNGVSTKGTKVKMYGLTYPYHEFHFTIANDDGSIVLPADILPSFFPQGEYDVMAELKGFEKYYSEEPLIIDEKFMAISIPLLEKRYPVKNLEVDNLRSIASWDIPELTLLNEKWNNPEVWPEDWENISDNVGWYYDTSYESEYWIVPERPDPFIISNDDLAGVGVDTYDILVTPACDLSVDEDLTLSFDSYYDGLYNSLAIIYYRLNEDSEWVLLKEMEPTPDVWTTENIPLTELTGLEGNNTIQFAFIHNDQEYWASGWALDNIFLGIENITPEGFVVYLDDEHAGETQLNEWFYPNLEYGTTYTASVAAKYSSGLSEEMEIEFTSDYLIAPREYSAATTGEAIVLNWKTPRYYAQDGWTGEIPENLLGFSIFKDDDEEPFDWVPVQNDLNEYSYIKEMLPGTYEFSISAKYDLTPYNIPGEDYSELIGPKSVELIYGYELPFYEDWESMSFETQEWTADENWLIVDNPTAETKVATFYFMPEMINYESDLTSPPINASEISLGELYFDFELMLKNNQNSGTEMLEIQIGANGVWTTLDTFDNEEEFDWTFCTYEISDYAKGEAFQIRFAAYGDNTSNIQGWFIDDVLVYRNCEPAPTNLQSDIIYDPTTPDDNGIFLSWDYPEEEPEPASDLAKDEGEILVLFEVYRKVDSEGEFELIATLEETGYLDPEENLNPGGLYEYYVKAGIADDNDDCLTDPTNIVAEIWQVGLGESEALSYKMYPNPTDSKTYIEAGGNITRVRISNKLGQTTIVHDVNANKCEIDLGQLTPGVYLMHIETDNATYTEKVFVY